MAKPTPEQLAKINRFAKSPMDSESVHVHSFRLLGTGFIPSRFLQFDASLMNKYLANVNNGDVVQIADHSFGGWGDNITLPFGRFFEGEVVQDGGKYQLDGTMYMTKGAKTYIGDFTTDDISSQIDSGILHDSSVSVTWGFSECSVCHCDIRDWQNCNHWPGKTYEQADGSEALCYVIAKPAPPPRMDNSCMIENSIVCAGAYPDAGVLSVNGKAKLNQGNDPDVAISILDISSIKLAKPDTQVICHLSSTSATFQVESENLRDASELHQIYHQMYSETELPEGWTKARLNAEHKKVVQALLDEGHEHFMVDALDGALNDALKAKSTKGSDNVDEKEKLAFETEIGELKQSVTAKDTEIADLTAKVATLTPLADLGTKYREDVVATALASGVRDQGNEFDEDTYREMFSTLDVEKVKSFGAKWEASALARLGVPAGHTQGEELNLPGSETQKAVDPNLFKVGRK